MSPEQSLASTALASWTMNLDRAEKFFFALTDQQLELEVGPGRNRLMYLFGHLIAVHDAMLPLLGIGERLHPELDARFLTSPDRAVATLPSRTELHRLWADVHGALKRGFDHFSPADWTQKHTAMSQDDFAANPLRNRLAVLLNRTAHMAGHLGQALLAGVSGAAAP